MDSRTRIFIALLVLILVLVGCEQPESPASLEGLECAVYAAVLEEVSLEVQSYTQPIPVLITPSITGEYVRSFPDWESWVATSGDHLPAETPLELVAFTPSNPPGPIICTFDNLANWREASLDGERVGWLHAPQEGMSIIAGATAELHLSPVYLSPNGRWAMLRIETLRVTNEVYLSGGAQQWPRGGPAYLLERNESGVWCVVGTAW